MAVLALAAVMGWLAEISWWRRVASIALVGSAVVAWTSWCLGDRRRHLILGLLALLTASAAQFRLLPIDQPASAAPWIWVAAFLLLAEPATRALRWGMGLVG